MGSKEIARVGIEGTTIKLPSDQFSIVSLKEEETYEVIDHDNRVIYVWQGSNAECETIFKALDHAKELVEGTLKDYTLERVIDGGESEEFLSLFQ